LLNDLGRFSTKVIFFRINGTISRPRAFYYLQASKFPAASLKSAAAVYDTPNREPGLRKQDPIQ
jgi:hypothetical protein